MSIPAGNRSAPLPTERRSGAKAVPAGALLKSLPLFKALDEASLARLAAATHRRVLARGERVFSRGDDPDFSRLLRELAAEELLRIDGRRITLLQPLRLAALRH